MDEFDKQQPPAPSYAADPNKEVMSVKDWLITLIIFIIPCVGFIMYFVWAFGAGNENRKNYCRANLILAAIVIVLYIVLVVILLALGMSIPGMYDSF